MGGGGVAFVPISPPLPTRLKQSPNGKLLLFSKWVLLLIVSELSSGLLPLPFKVCITIDKLSPYVKLLLFSKRVLLVIVSETVEWAIALSETVEWAIAMLVAPLELYCAIVSGYYLSFKLSAKVVFSVGPELPTGDGWERTSHWSCIAPLEIIFLDTI